MYNEVIPIHEKIDKSIRANPTVNYNLGINYNPRYFYLPWVEEIHLAIEEESWRSVKSKMSS